MLEELAALTHSQVLTLQGGVLAGGLELQFDINYQLSDDLIKLVIGLPKINTFG